MNSNDIPRDRLALLLILLFGGVSFISIIAVIVLSIMDKKVDPILSDILKISTGALVGYISSVMTFYFGRKES